MKAKPSYHRAAQDLSWEVIIDHKTEEKARQPRKGMKVICRRSFLLRLWCSDEIGDLNWQASLENPENGERFGFGSLEELFTYLMDLATLKDR